MSAFEETRAKEKQKHQENINKTISLLKGMNGNEVKSFIRFLEEDIENKLTI